MSAWTRRRFLGAASAAVAGLPLLLGRAAAQGGPARRFVVFYYPDGVPGPSQDGEPSAWHPSGGERDFALPDLLSPLAPWRDHLLFFRGLHMGGTDEGSHPGGARKLLTAADHGNNESFDRVLARTLGADRPHRHVYLGAMANHNNASGDKHISYPAPGHTEPPEDDPVRAFDRLFAGAGPGGPDPAVAARRARRLSILDAVADELTTLRGRVGGAERAKLEQHLEGLREVERRVGDVADLPAADQCTDAPASLGQVRPAALYDPANLPAILRAQTDTLVQALACGLTRVGVLQASHHTSELIMSRFEGSALHTPNFDMRSHQASHYGARHSGDLYTAYVAQRRWWSEQFAYLLAQLAARPEGDGTLLDHTVVLCCSEVCDGNTHRHSDMPFVVAGGQATGLRTGRLIDTGGRLHGDLYAALAHALGTPMDRFGPLSGGVLGGLT